MNDEILNDAYSQIAEDYNIDMESNLEPKYKNFFIDNGRIFPNENGRALAKLKPGSYTLNFDPMSKRFWFERMKIVSDSILDLPSPEYEQIIREMNFFIKPNIKTKFNDLGFIYKRSVLLHGKPGTGKTVISNRISKDIINVGGIVLWVNDPNLLVIAFSILKDIQPETLTGVIFEEFDEMARRNESMLLTLLDGQVQKENVVYLGTTNYIEKVPKRLYRPGRFSSVIEVKFPTSKAREVFLSSKLGKDFIDMEFWIKNTEGLSIDELKEMIQSVYILENPFKDVLKRIQDTKGIEEYDDEPERNKSAYNNNYYKLR